MSEDHLVNYCAPTLAGIKTGSLFGCSCPCADSLRKTVRGLNKRLLPKGLRVLPLRFSNQRALIYVYRPSGLKQDLSQETALRLLKDRGYCTDSCEKCIAQLSRKLHESEEFPHEIGLFLGYPPEDVQGYMENKACRCKCAGCWKVYGDEEAARKKFEQYHKCSRIYQKCWASGCSLERLAITR